MAGRSKIYEVTINLKYKIYSTNFEKLYLNIVNYPWFISIRNANYVSFTPPVATYVYRCTKLNNQTIFLLYNIIKYVR